MLAKVHIAIVSYVYMAMCINVSCWICRLSATQKGKQYLLCNYSRTSIIRTPVCHFNVKSVQINEFVLLSELSNKIHYLASYNIAMYMAMLCTITFLYIMVNQLRGWPII